MGCSWKVSLTELAARRGARLSLRLVAGLVWLACGARAPAQQPPPPPDQEAQIAVRVELVNVDVTVTDARGNYLRDLRKEQFRLLDEGEPQQITHFLPVDAPARVLLLVEAGPAVYLIHRQHLTAAHLLLRGLAADDEVALAAYGDAVEMVSGFTRDKPALQRQIAGLRYNLGRGDLNLFASLASALDWLAETPGKKSLVLLSTGLDSSPSSNWDLLMERLRRSEATIYAVALGGELRDPPPERKGGPVDTEAQRVAERFAQAGAALHSIAEATGGLAFFPRKPEDFAQVYKDIATVLRHTYRLGFTPPRRDGQFHRIRVEIAVPPERLAKLKGGGLTAHFRAGYFAPGP